MHIQDRRKEQDRKRKVQLVSSVTKVVALGIDCNIITKEQSEKVASMWKSPGYWSLFISHFFLNFGMFNCVAPFSSLHQIFRLYLY